MKQKSKDQIKRQGMEDSSSQQRATNQGGHEGGHHGGQGHGGQHSGGMGGEHGGDLHDVGSQSGMGGGAPGSGGQDSGYRQAAHQGQPRQSSGNPEDDRIGMDEPAEVQQSAQREGMGHHRHSSRGNEQNLDGTIDIDDLGSHGNAAGTSR